jgi:siroheme decarboxylase
MQRMRMTPPTGAAPALDDIDRHIINSLQGGFPICARPFDAAAEAIGISGEALIERLERLLAARLLSRFGPLYNADRMGGANVLAAMSVPERDFQNVAEFVNLQPEIAHNYRREHELNMWFVGAAQTPEKVETTFSYIEAMTGYHILRFPKLREFFVELKLNV